jgi:hypothetical protein
VNLPIVAFFLFGALAIPIAARIEPGMANAASARDLGRDVTTALQRAAESARSDNGQ